MFSGLFLEGGGGEGGWGWGWGEFFVGGSCAVGVEGWGEDVVGAHCEDSRGGSILGGGDLLMGLSSLRSVF